MCTGARYLGGFIGDGKYKRNWLEKITKTWEQNITRKSKTARKYNQESYAAVVRVIQMGWIFLQFITKNTGDKFMGMEKLLQIKILPRLLIIK